VLARLEARGAALAWTGRDGALILPLGEARRDAAIRAWGLRRSCPGDPEAKNAGQTFVAPGSTSD